ncbi:MAG TPA: ABC transporter ATP-binding protein [Acidimicrobiia bacterium]|jgi:putative ABC transport system ATP-binding protein|nr:ABC transporter ATP-binding protein [Acidimicrobiia bacterium]
MAHAVDASERGHVVRMHNVHRTYRRGSVLVPVLRGIELEVATGEWVAILGPSGSGKSTLLNILGLLDRPNLGSYELEGADVARLGDSRQAELRNRYIGFVFQSFQLLPRTSALENVATPLVYRRARRADRLEAARRALDAVGLEERADHDPGELSGGETQRVAIARALVTDPALLLADEPTGNLDTASGAEVLSLLGRLHAQGRTIVVITHEPSVADLADRRLTLRDGQLEAA